MPHDDLLAELRARISEIESNNVEGISEDSGIPSHKGSDYTEWPDAHNARMRTPSSDDAAPHDASAALKKIVALVNVSDRSERAIRDRLKRCDFDDASIEEAVAKAKDYGFIDDARYADVLIRSRVSQGRGSSGIERELRDQGIDPNTIAGWPYDYNVDADDELDRALSFLERKPPRSKNLRDGAYRKLMQRGFPSSVASSAARIWSEKQEYQ